jgi:hypothetical protein
MKFYLFDRAGSSEASIFAQLQFTSHCVSGMAEPSDSMGHAGKNICMLVEFLILYFFRPYIFSFKRKY